MRNFLPVAALLLGAAVLWFVLSGDDPSGPEDPGGGASSSADDGPGALLVGGGPENGGDGTGTKRPKSLPGLDPRTAPRGDLTVWPVDENGDVIPVDKVKVHLKSAGLPWPGQPLGHRNRETNAWEFRKVFTGKVRVIVTGDTFRDTVVEARVTVRPQTPLRVTVPPAGAIHFVVKHDDGTPANDLTLELQKNGRVVSAWYQERHRLRMTSRKRMREAKLGHAGYITGLDEGSYTLRATNKDGYYREQDVDVVPGQIAEVRMQMRNTADAPPKQPPPRVEPPPRPPDEKVERHPDAGGG